MLPEIKEQFADPIEDLYIRTVKVNVESLWPWHGRKVVLVNIPSTLIERIILFIKTLRWVTKDEGIVLNNLRDSWIHLVGGIEKEVSSLLEHNEKRVPKKSPHRRSDPMNTSMSSSSPPTDMKEFVHDYEAYDKCQDSNAIPSVFHRILEMVKRVERGWNSDTFSKEAKNEYRNQLILANKALELLINSNTTEVNCDFHFAHEIIVPHMGNLS